MSADMEATIRRLTAERDSLAQTLYDFEEWLGQKADDTRAAAHKAAEPGLKAPLTMRANALQRALLVLREMRYEDA